jgi:Vacuolar protein sorting-associated protein 62
MSQTSLKYLILAVLSLVGFMSCYAHADSTLSTTTPSSLSSSVRRGTNVATHIDTSSLTYEQVMNDPATALSLYRPVYWIHSRERFYPVSPVDFIEACSLYKDKQLLIPRLDADGNQLMDQDVATANQRGLAKLQAANITLDIETVQDLAGAPYMSQNGTTLTAVIGNNAHYELLVEDMSVLVGDLNSPDFLHGKTWYENGAPECPQSYVGGNCSQFAATVVAENRNRTFAKQYQTAYIRESTIDGVAYVDFEYVTYLAYDGAIAVVPGLGEHTWDVEHVAVRFEKSNMTAPMRVYFSQHSGASWVDADKVSFKTDLSDSGMHLIVYWGRESHESYPYPGRHQRLFTFGDDVTDEGVLWVPDTLYVPRDGMNNVDESALRCSLDKHNPSHVMVVDPQTREQHPWVFFAGVAVSQKTIGDHEQGVYLSRPSIALSEGPSQTPQGLKAARHSEPGVTVMPWVSKYIGPSYRITCGPQPAPPTPKPYYPPVNFKFGVGSNGTHIDFTKPEGQYILAGISNGAFPFIEALLPVLHIDPLVITPKTPIHASLPFTCPTGTCSSCPAQVKYGITVSSITVSGLSKIKISRVDAVDANTFKFTMSDVNITASISGDHPLNLTATIPPATAPQTASVAATISLNPVSIAAELDAKFPLAFGNRTDGSSFFVPDTSFWQLGSYLNATQAASVMGMQATDVSTTSTIDATIIDIAVPSGMKACVDAFETSLEGLLKALFNTLVSGFLKSEINKQLTGLFTGKVQG